MKTDELQYILVVSFSLIFLCNHPQIFVELASYTEVGQNIANNAMGVLEITHVHMFTINRVQPGQNKCWSGHSTGSYKIASEIELVVRFVHQTTWIDAVAMLIEGLLPKDLESED